jgi:glutathione S-transferase
MTITLYELAGADPERRFSPYCWRTRLALAHKGLAVEGVPWRFTDKAAIAFSGQGKVPVMVDDGRTIFDSWTIADHLEASHPDRPLLFLSPGERALAKFVSAWTETVVHAALFRIVALDIWSHIAEQDKAYFRKSREERFGISLEAMVADPAEKVAAFRASLTPLRTMLQGQPYLGGETPGYGDYIVLGAFQWARCISPVRLLADDDPVAAWRQRLFDAFDGLAGKAVGYPA